MAVDGALKVPVSAVFPLAEAPGASAGPMAVFAVVDGRARQTPVEVGARNGSEAWLVKGVTLGQPVIVYPPPRVKDGARVEPRRMEGN